MTAVLGVDPGHKETGVTLVSSLEGVVWFDVIERADAEWRDYLDAVVDSVAKVRDLVDLVAIEDVKPPSAFMGGRRQFVSFAPLLGTARVLGAVEGFCIARGLPTTVVAPGKNGSAPLVYYRQRCPALVGPRERTGTSALLRHARSAFDVAAQALVAATLTSPR